MEAGFGPPSEPAPTFRGTCPTKDPTTDGLGRPDESRRRFTCASWHPPSLQWLRSCCGLCDLCGCPSPTNKILPVTTAPTQCDFLEIRPNRRIRVIHQREHLRPPPPLQRSATTLSRSREERDGGGVGSRRSKQVSESEDEEYWFENASPKRIPIQQPPPSTLHPPNRIFNKFEPQEPPRIAGIKPPRASIVSMKNGSSSNYQSQHVTHDAQVCSPGQQRLQRKKIIPTEQLNLDDDEDLVHDLEPPPPLQHSVVEENFVASVLAGMSDLVISITADATEARNISSPSLNDTRRSSSPSSSNEASPKPNEKRVTTEPDPVEKISTSESTTVLVDGGHLGGMANVGYEGEDEVDSRISNGNLDSTSYSSDSDQDSADAGYKRNRDLSEIVTNTATNHPEVTTPLPPSNDIPSNVLPPPPVSESRPIMFFLHGVGGSASTWTSQIDFFTSLGYEVIAPDLLGHGFSSVPDLAKAYTFGKLFRDTLTIFDHYVGDGRPCVIVAHSYGCAFAAALARTRPNSVTMLLLLACGGPTPLAPPPTAESMPAALLKLLLKCGVRRNQQYNPKGKAMKFQEAYDVPAYVFRHIVAGQDWPEGDATFHRRISVPTLLIYGLKDPFVSLVEMCEMERTIPRSYLELIPLAGHMIMLDQPKELNIMMKRFIEKYDRP